MDINALAQTLLAIMLPPLVAVAIEYLRRKIGLERLAYIKAELEAKQELALLAVRFAEQTFKTAKGYEKYDYAAEWLTERLGEKGIIISASEIKGFVEAALRMIKDEFGETWADISAGTSTQ